MGPIPTLKQFFVILILNEEETYGTIQNEMAGQCISFSDTLYKQKYIQIITF